MSLSVENLACARGGVPVLEGISFALAAGEALILRGPNGVGKTTLLRTLAGLQPAIAGSMNFDPESTAFSSHADGIKSALTVEENLRFWAQLYARTLPEDLFTHFDLQDLRSRLAANLSAGQKRRLGLARLGVLGRQILFLDEPTVSLDESSVSLFAQFLKNQHLARGGIAIIATHIALGLDAPVLDLAPFKASPDARGGNDEAFL